MVKIGAITCAAMTLCLSAMRLHLQQAQSLNLQCRLWPFSHEIIPWFRQRAHFGLRPPLFSSPLTEFGDISPGATSPFMLTSKLLWSRLNLFQCYFFCLELFNVKCFWRFSADLRRRHTFTHLRSRMMINDFFARWQRKIFFSHPKDLALLKDSSSCLHNTTHVVAIAKARKIFSPNFSLQTAFHAFDRRWCFCALSRESIPNSAHFCYVEGSSLAKRKPMKKTDLKAR